MTSARWLTFDCYGTLIDWRTGMTDALESIAPGRSQDLIEAYHRYEPEVEMEEPFRNYRAVLGEVLRRAAASLDIPLTDVDSDVLSKTLPTWPAFSDSVATLEKLRDAGWKLAILSNTDIDLIEGTLGGPLPVVFDEVITAEEVRSYKPGPGMFDTFIERKAPGTDGWIHVGTSVIHDCEPTIQRGFASVLVHRGNWHPGTPTDGGCASLVLKDLGELPERLQVMP